MVWLAVTLKYFLRLVEPISKPLFPIMLEHRALGDVSGQLTNLAANFGGSRR
jgi:spore maturation protein SpmA